MQQQTKKKDGRPLKGTKRRRTTSLCLDEMTWSLIDALVDVTPRANRGTVVETALWKHAVSLGRVPKRLAAEAKKAGFLKDETLRRDESA